MPPPSTTTSTTVAPAATTVPPPPSTSPTAVRRGPARSTPTVANRSRPPRRITGGDVWARLAQCESGGNARAVNPSGKYRGAFQFSLATWHAIGMTGDPIDHPYSVQLAAAQRLQARSGWGQWPQCARRLGLR